MANERIMKYDADDTTSDPESKKTQYHSYKYRGRNRRIKVGVAKDGGIFIKTRRLINGKVVVSKVCYSPGGVARILDGIKRGIKFWKKEVQSEAK